MDIYIDKDTMLPFDLYGDLENEYDAAERYGRVEIVETMDTMRLWNEKQCIDRAVLGKGPEGTGGGGHAFFWSENDIDDNREKCEWMDRPDLAQYWYKLAAEAGYIHSQNYLAALYCPELEPLNVFKLGRFARHWWELSAKQKLPNGMRNLAHCLRCGKCCCCDRDIARADAIEKEANEIDKQKEN